MSFRYNVEVHIMANKNQGNCLIQVQEKVEKVLADAFGKENIRSFPHPEDNQLVIELYLNVPEAKIQKPIVLKPVIQTK
jgi:hypothetical protein